MMQTACRLDEKEPLENITCLHVILELSPYNTDYVEGSYKLLMRIHGGMRRVCRAMGAEHFSM